MHWLPVRCTWCQKQESANKHSRSRSRFPSGAAVGNKLKAENMRSSFRLLCSYDVPAPTNAEPLQALTSNHPLAPTDRMLICSYTGNLRFQPLQVSSDDLINSLRTFPTGCKGGPDGLTAAHLSDIAQQRNRWQAERRTSSTCCSRASFLFQSEKSYTEEGWSFFKRDGSLRLIAVGYALRRLAAKCANAFVIKRKGEELKPIQVGVGISAGAEAAVYAIRLLSNLRDNHVFVKIEFLERF